MQDSAPGAEENLPKGHASQSAESSCPSAEEDCRNLPMGQSKHVSMARSPRSLYLPLGQTVQTWIAFMYVPTPHGAHAAGEVEPAGDDLPDSQSVQDEYPEPDQ